MNGTELALSAFTFYGEDNELLAEASSLGWTPGYYPSSLTVKGETETVTYRYASTKTDGEGDILCWLYTPVGNYPALTIFND